ncbi:MAG: hypothetical protein SRB2_04524 [Desulfobacteraceae bacterium Eth-SRB2]|nr:MAG: hypothetical protein SRB2_04524 [Desulfobacteraceae bacterium Eth-SRB2]
MKKWSICLMAIALIIFCFHSLVLAGDTKAVNLHRLNLFRFLMLKPPSKGSV